MKKTAFVVAILLLIALLVVSPLVFLPGASFGGSDDAASQVVERVQGGSYTPWFTPVLETLLGGELPSEVESLIFCLQAALGSGVLAFGFGYLVARRRYAGKDGGEDIDTCS